ncbi:2Fe-2S iron-sulfur cluster-binding protein [Hymenobacter sp. GOD-10R]|uniref:2Fe-2S iron-sulfur cluster-binding protein n=1 Tax=Hymenobacter sp. GOD-10R TaxID=3093922 RepID=UPI002D78F14B|nr:2Fe-2S iron-sulfur cluster-binding protein [Hymenobacter sp. GOD-10R]WRQ28691.1 2Fe-2S iron-sulfur cluster-binding protein [Hymenobacter sp. GOD-10R]
MSFSIEQILRGDIPRVEHRPPSAADPGLVPVSLRINGQTYDLQLEPRVSLLDALREFIGLTGTKKGCNQGACGACTVLIEDERVNSCLTFAIMHEGQEITTIEGLGTPNELHPLQAAFIEHDGFQCGYCTPGQICSAVAMLKEVEQGDASVLTPDLAATKVELTDEELRERMSGNVCRCGAYLGIIDAIRDVYEQQKGPQA